MQSSASRVSTAVIGVLLLSMSTSVLGGIIDLASLRQDQVPVFKVDVDSAPTAHWQYTPPVAAFHLANNPGGGYALKDLPGPSNILGNRAKFELVDLQFHPDPFVLNNLLITNTTAIPQIFSVTVGLPTSFAAPNLISGTITTSVIDGGTDGATLTSVAPNAVYTAQIDFNPVATLQNDPFTLTALPGLTNSATAVFGPTASAVPVVSNIGIQIRFSLSAGDTAAILSRFDVNVPEPGSIGICAVGILLLARRGRRPACA